MAIQSGAVARGRSDALVGALTIALVAIVAASVFTVVERWTTETPSGTTAATRSAQQVLVDIRAGERAPLTTTSEVLSQVRLGEKALLLTQQDVTKALADVRAAERAMPAVTTPDLMSSIRQAEKDLVTSQSILDKALVEIRAAEREGR